jgi:hypothetical protein
MKKSFKISLIVLGVLLLMGGMYSFLTFKRSCRDCLVFETRLEICESYKGTWVDSTFECEGISEENCEDLTGSFNECASACRNNPEAEVCTLQCVPVCSF